MVDIVSDGPIFRDFSHIFGLVCIQIHIIIHPTIKKYINIIHKKINLNYQFTVPELAEMEEGVPRLGWAGPYCSPGPSSSSSLS